MVLKEIYQNVKRYAEGTMMLGVLTVLSVVSLETILNTKQNPLANLRRDYRDSTNLIYRNDRVDFYISSEKRGSSFIPKIEDFDSGEKIEQNTNLTTERKHRFHDFIFSP